MSEEDEAPRTVSGLKVWLGGMFLLGSTLGGGASSLLGSQDVGRAVDKLTVSVDSMEKGMDSLREDLKDLRLQVREAGAGRWTRVDHVAYAEAQTRALARLQARMDRLEDRAK